jgi:hypothetical protein
MAQPLPQPDFTVISDGFNLLSEQFQRCRNLPAVQGGDHLLQALEALNTNFTALREDVTAMRGDVRDLGTRLDTMLVHPNSTLSLPRC